MTKNNITRTVPVGETLLQGAGGLAQPGRVRVREWHTDWELSEELADRAKEGEAGELQIPRFAAHLRKLQTMNGVHAHTLQDLLRHKTAAMTARQSYLAPAHLQRAAKLMDKILTA